MKQVFVFVRSFALLLLTVTIFFASCKKSDHTPSTKGPDVNFYVLNDNNTILYLNGKSVNTPLKTIAVTGILNSEKLLGIDFRPNTGQLFAISSGSRLYTVNLQTGAATAIGAAAFTPVLDGTLLGFDFNPTVDRIRVVTNTGQNLRLNPETGVVAAVDGTVANASVNAVAYTQSRAACGFNGIV